MCGIAGIVQLDGATASIHALRRMTDSQRHRGPDDQGYRMFSLSRSASQDWVRDSSSGSTQFDGGIGFNRLSILDLSAAGHQPMCNEDESIFIAFNGEVYNAFDYWPELKAAGFQFRSRTDTEVILYLYQHYGLDGMLSRLNGMFAIAIVDLNRHELILARDRLGIKPMYWWSDNKVLLFASEAKAFLAHPSFRAELDSEIADEFFLFRYCASDRSLLKGVRQLEPGQWMRVRQGHLHTQYYWKLPDQNGEDNRTLGQAADELDRMLSHSVKSQLLSDVKVGCQLSGGLDSSLVSLLAAREQPGSIDGFSIVFQDPRFSEEKWIGEAARTAGIGCHKFRLNADNFHDSLQTASWHLDHPLNHPNSLGIYFLSEQARSSITVFLSGEGADELFGGYTRFLYAALRARLRPVVPWVKWVPRLGKRFATRFEGMEDDAVWFILQSAFINPERLRLLKPDSRADDVIARRRAIFDEGSGDLVSRCLKYELRTYLVDLLLRQDKMTMAHSIENRVPYLDHKLVEFVLGLPTRFLVGQSLVTTRPRMGNTKIVLKNLARRYFPKRFVYRSKIGFPIPLRPFFNSPGFRASMEDVLIPGMRKRGVINCDVVQNWWRNLSTLDDAGIEALWVCASFELWAQQFLDKSFDAMWPQSATAALSDS